MMMSRKGLLKSHILSWRRMVYSDWEDVTSSGRAFQVVEPATGKARLYRRLIACQVAPEDDWCL